MPPHSLGASRSPQGPLHPRGLHRQPAQWVAQAGGGGTGADREPQLLWGWWDTRWLPPCSSGLQWVQVWVSSELPCWATPGVVSAPSGVPGPPAPLPNLSTCRTLAWDSGLGARQGRPLEQLHASPRPLCCWHGRGASPHASSQASGSSCREDGLCLAVTVPGW